MRRLLFGKAARPMFENVLGQEASRRLSLDLASGTLPPALLFSGPPASGKGTAALELARALSCERAGAPWNCSCASCERHRLLSHPDLLLLGPRAFASELAASAAAFLREPESAARMLFVRSARKLLSRFSPVLWEGDETKFAKASTLSAAMGEDLEELYPPRPLPEGDKLGKLVSSVLSAALKLEDEGIADSIPIAQIRKLSYWARLAPTGKRKLILLENADRMQEGARNALLKILEEPPETAVIVLSTARRGAMMPTILSRLRPYAFARRAADIERDVIRRVFRDADALSAGADSVSGYLETFLPVPPAALEAAASAFLSASDARSAAASVLQSVGKFEPRSVFASFLSRLLSAVSASLREKPQADARAVVAAEKLSAAVRRADLAVGTYNQAPPLALERLFVELREARSAAVRSTAAGAR